jgi:hypothetical protein
MVGYRMPQGLSFSLGYDIGLTNIEKGGFGDETRNRSFSFSVGYSLDKLLGKKK